VALPEITLLTVATKEREFGFLVGSHSPKPWPQPQCGVTRDAWSVLLFGML
jgi:hypothetical protein